MKINKRISSKGVFITGTDTRVGKTIVSASLAAWCRLHGIDVGVMKPVATGASFKLKKNHGKRLISSDAHTLSEMAQSGDPMLDVNPVIFKEALSPYAASVIENRLIRLDPIIRSFKRIRRRHSFVIVEGIGGIMVPITRNVKVSDLIRMMGLPCIIVARLGLGTLNHTLLSVEHALRSGIKVSGVILNQTGISEMKDDGRLACKTNPDVLRGILRVPVLGVLKYKRNFAGSRFDPKELSSWIEKGLGSDFLKVFFSTSTLS